MFSHIRPSCSCTSGATPPQKSASRSTDAARKIFAIGRSIDRCMKCFTTSDAFQTAIPNAVISVRVSPRPICRPKISTCVSIPSPTNGPTMLTASSTSSST